MPTTRFSKCSTRCQGRRETRPKGGAKHCHRGRRGEMVRGGRDEALGRPRRSRFSCGGGMFARSLGLACRGSRILLGWLRSFSRLRPMCRHGAIPRWPFRAHFGFAVGVSWVAFSARDDGMSAPAPWFYLDADGFFASCEEAADAPWSLSTGRRAARGWPHRVARWGPVPVRSGRRVAPPLCEGPSVRRWALDRVHGAPVRAGPFRCRSHLLRRVALGRIAFRRRWAAFLLCVHRPLPQRRGPAR